MKLLAAEELERVIARRLTRLEKRAPAMPGLTARVHELVGQVRAVREQLIALAESPTWTLMRNMSRLSAVCFTDLPELLQDLEELRWLLQTHNPCEEKDAIVADVKAVREDMAHLLTSAWLLYTVVRAQLPQPQHLDHALPPLQVASMRAWPGMGLCVRDTVPLSRTSSLLIAIESSAYVSSPLSAMDNDTFSQMVYFLDLYSVLALSECSVDLNSRIRKQGSRLLRHACAGLFPRVRPEEVWLLQRSPDFCEVFSSLVSRKKKRPRLEEQRQMHDEPKSIPKRKLSPRRLAVALSPPALLSITVASGLWAPQVVALAVLGLCIILATGLCIAPRHIPRPLLLLRGNAVRLSAACAVTAAATAVGWAWYAALAPYALALALYGRWLVKTPAATTRHASILLLD